MVRRSDQFFGHTAAAAAAKSGALKGFFKIIAVGAFAGLVAVGVFLRNLFKKRQSNQ